MVIKLVRVCALQKYPSLSWDRFLFLGYDVDIPAWFQAWQASGKKIIYKIWQKIGHHILTRFKMG